MDTPTPPPRNQRRLQVQAARRIRSQSRLSLDIPRTRPSKRRRLAIGTGPKTTTKFSPQALQALGNNLRHDCECEPMFINTQRLTSTDNPVKEVPEPEAEVSWEGDEVGGGDGGSTDLEVGLMLLEANHRATLARMREIIEIGDKRQEELCQRLQEVRHSWANESTAVQQQRHKQPLEFHKEDGSELAKFHCHCLLHSVEGITDDTASIRGRSSADDELNLLVGIPSPRLKCSLSVDQLSFETSRGEDLRLLGLFNDLTIGHHTRTEIEKTQTLPTIPLLHPTRPAKNPKQKAPQSVSTSSRQSTRSNSLDNLYDLYNPRSLGLSNPLGTVITTREEMDPETGHWVTIREDERSNNDSRPLQETNSDVSELDITTCTPAKHREKSTQQLRYGIATQHDDSDDEITPKAQRVQAISGGYPGNTGEETGLDIGRNCRVSIERERELDGLRALAASVDLDGEGGVSLLLAEDPEGAG